MDVMSAIAFMILGAVIWQLIDSFGLPDPWSIWLAARKNVPGWLIWIGGVFFAIGVIFLVYWAILLQVNHGQASVTPLLLLVLFLGLFFLIVSGLWIGVRNFLNKHPRETWKLFKFERRPKTNETKVVKEEVHPTRESPF